jgi:hypothetical protein
MTEMLADSSFLYALFNQDDRYYPRASRFAAHNETISLTPDVVLPEVTFLFNRNGGIPAVASFLEAFQAAGIRLECLASEDLARAREILLSYPTAHFDFVDCCIMALSERLDITQVCTFDRRDFSIFRPRHCDFLTLLP